MGEGKFFVIKRWICETEGDSRQLTHMVFVFLSPDNSSGSSSDWRGPGGLQRISCRDDGEDVEEGAGEGRLGWHRDPWADSQGHQ